MPWRLFLWALSSRPEMLFVLAFTMLGVAAAELSIPWVLARAVDAAVEARSPALIDRLGLVMLALIGALYGVHVLYLRTETRIVRRGTFRLRQLLYATLLDQPIGYFSRRRTGELTHRVLNDAAVLDTHGVYVIGDLPFSVLTVLGVVILMGLAQWRLALLVVGFCRRA